MEYQSLELDQEQYYLKHHSKTIINIICNLKEKDLNILPNNFIGRGVEENVTTYLSV